MDFIKDNLVSIIGIIITAVVGYIGQKIKAYLEQNENRKYLKDLVESTVKAVEQMYNGLSGTEKYEMAVENISQCLENKNIFVSEIELKILIEAVVAELNKPWQSADNTTE